RISPAWRAGEKCRQSHDPPPASSRSLGPRLRAGEPLPSRLHEPTPPEDRARSRPPTIPADRNRSWLPLSVDELIFSAGRSDKRSKALARRVTDLSLDI